MTDKKNVKMLTYSVLGKASNSPIEMLMVT
jgi:hypothetical protein